MGKNSISIVSVVVGVAVLLFVLAVLGISIATLVKVSNDIDSRPATRLPTGSTKPGPNIPSQPVSSSDKYKMAASFLGASLNTSVSPCEDFYGYSCGTYTDVYDILTRMQADIIGDLLKYLSGIGTSAIAPLQKYKKYNDACAQYAKDPSTLTADGKYTKQQVAAFTTASGNLPFPVMDGTDPAAWPTADVLATSLGYLHVATLIDFMVQPDPVNPTGSQPYWLVLLWPQNVDDTVIEADGYADKVKALLTKYAQVDAKTPTDAILQADAAGIVALEKGIVGELKKAGLTGAVAQKDLRNPVAISAAQTTYGTFLTVRNLITQLIANADDTVKTKLTPDAYQISIPTMTDTFLKGVRDNMLKDGNAYGIRKRDVYNYLYYKLIERYATFLPQDKTAATKAVSLMEIVHRHMKKQKKRNPLQLQPVPSSFGLLDDDNVVLAEADDNALAVACALKTKDQLAFASSRAYVDAMLPTAQQQADMRTAVGQMLTDVIVAFQSMIDQIDWMSDTSKKSAYAKISKIAMNLGWHDTVTDDTKLTAYYAPLDFSTTQNFIEMLLAVQNFEKREMLARLTRTQADGTDKTYWGGSSSPTANAFYQPQFNSITIPLGILRQPFFDPQWPTSVNYGAIGIVLGHELVHGFDTQGVQWDADGENTNWMDKASQDAFDVMAKCVIDEYSSFCPLDASKYTPNCVQGAVTQTENIADNGGMRAAFRAYHNHVGLKGPDPLLPGNILSQYDHDQLFFLSFATTWCQKPTDDMLGAQIASSDPHSPDQFRIQGTMRNFQSFRASYQCPAGSKYAPEKHCDVYISSPKFDESKL